MWIFLIILSPLSGRLPEFGVLPGASPSNWLAAFQDDAPYLYWQRYMARLGPLHGLKALESRVANV